LDAWRSGVVRRSAAGLTCAVLLTGLAACTGGDVAEPAPGPSSPPAATGTSATLTPRPVPLTVRVTRVAGRLRPKARTALEHNVGRVVGRYFHDAFLGDYPRTDFHDAFATFSRDAEQRARADRALLTNAELGPSTQAVTPRVEKAYLSVLAPNKVAAGVTARVRLEMVADRDNQQDRRVTVTGRLLLTRKKSGGWQIFGYDLSRSTVPVAKGASR
jgi:hypothetical protein